ncbi:MAG: response regulator [Chloroflexi bacterium]|nr:response regulator [Chloroflexota bacterium]
MGVILIVEDELTTQLMLKLIMQRNNHEVVIANDGEDALAQLEEKTVDLVIADVNMPRMSGLTMLERLREDKRFENLPIIMFTAVGNKKTHLEATQKGATHFLTKPVSSGKLAEIVDQHLESPPV